VTGIAEWLKKVGLEKYAPVFTEHELTLDVLPHLTESDIDRLGLPIGPRRRLLVEIRALIAHASTPAAQPPASPAVHPSATPAAERRQITVMFCDLVGSTSLAERLDAEELRELMGTYRRACGDVVTRYDGHVAQYLGDGLMVYFGWPHAHEDDPERAVRAALDMVQAVQQIRAVRPLAVRIGLATGPVVVGDASHERHAEANLAVGETPNLAARLQGLAAAHEIVIAPATRRLVRDAFALTDLGAHALKGIAEPVLAWRVDRVARTQGRFEAAHGAMDLTPLVGREEEIALLLRRWQQASDGDGQVVLIGGEPGIGKSRLTQAFRKSLTGLHTILRYQCSPYHLTSALYPFIEQFEFRAGFARDDTPEQKLDKLEAAFAGTEAERHEAVPLLAAMLSLPTDRYPALTLSPQKRKEETFRALAVQLEALTREHPVLMLVEDVHWIDPTSQELLDLLVARRHGLRLLILATHRLEYVAPWTGQPHVSSLVLARLGRREGARLVDEVTGGRALPPEVFDEILDRTDGVPLFVEELTRSVLESGLLREAGDRYELRAPLASLAIPTSLRDSLMARLDRLAPVKEIAQMGACIGRSFSFELLARVSALAPGPLEAALEKLVDAGLVLRRHTAPDAIYTFKHALVQDAAYDSLLRSRRIELHARIAHVLEHEFAERVASEPEWLAHHHTQAGNPAAAIPLWRRAGELAIARVALHEAAADLQKGLALIDQLPASPERDRLELTIREPLNAAWTGLRGWAAAEVGENASAILQLSKGVGRTDSLLLGLWWMWTSTITQGRIADAVPWAERLLHEGRAADDLDLQIFGHAAAMVSHLLLGELVESREQADRVLALYDPRRAGRWLQLTGHDLRTFVEVYACQLLWMLGYPDEAIRVSEASRTHARDVGHAFNLVWAVTFGAYAFAYRRQPDKLLARVEEADRLAREQGIAFLYQVSVPQVAAIGELHRGHPREAVALLRPAIDAWTRVGGHVRIPYLKAKLAEATALAGDPDNALILADEALEQIERPAWLEREWLPEVLRVRAWILMRLGRDADAEFALRTSIDWARRQHAKSWELRSATNLADLLARRGERGAARDVLAPVYGWFTEGFDTPDLIEAKRLLESLTTGR
jgi:class 3 adenylate cyclase/tetratricopeptide (TPR) repeat protein